MPNAAPSKSLSNLTNPTDISWVHASALVAHATQLGLIEAPGGATGVDRIRNGVTTIANSHPWLNEFANPAVVRIFDSLPTAPVADIETMWTNEDLFERSQYGPAITGYALGDAYQRTSAEAVKGRALCQTPRYVADLLFDLALTPAHRETGPNTRVIDPSCGTGHLVMGAMLNAKSRPWGDISAREGRAFTYITPEQAVSTVAGVDLDPYAVLLTRYRLLTFLARADGRKNELVQTARDLPLQVVCADSLLDDHPVLARGQYDAVVGNPPYITARDAQQNAAIRARYPETTSGKYSLALPFFQLMNDLTRRGGYVAQITTNSFMKREFGKRFVEEYLPRLDLNWVIDTSGAYIPGHGTPTVILMHRNRLPVSERVNVVMGIRGEPSTPADPARGQVWTSISDAVRDRLSWQRFAAGAEEYAKSLQPSTATDARELERIVDARRTQIEGVCEQLALFDGLDAAAPALA